MTEGIVTPIASFSGSTARGSGGRAIGYAEFGDPNGKPVVLFHGFGDSRLTRYPDDELTARLGIRLITFDRPGIGMTDPMNELTILDRTDDAIDLANSLGLQDISLLGWSGGAPYALAAAGCMAGRVKRVAIVSGFGPFERAGFKRLAPREIKRIMTILKVAPWMANVMATESQKQLQGNAADAMEVSRGLGGSSDAGVLNMSGVRANVTAGAEEAFRQGPAGVANDMLLLFRFKWGFNPEDVHTPVDLWYGDDDRMTPPDVGRGLASILPQPRLRMVPGAGHLLYLRNWEEILRTLVADEAPATTATFQAIEPVAPSPVTESLAAAALTDSTPAVEPEHAEPAGEPVTAQDDVLASTPAWSWTQPEAASEPSVDAPAQEPAEREPAAAESEPVAPRDVAAFTPRPRPAAASGDQLARLRALGFVVDVPEPEAAEPEAIAQTDAATAEAEAAAEPAAEAAAGEHEVAADRPELKLVERQTPPRRPSLNWQPNRVPGLIIGKPRRVAPAEPVAPVAEPTPEPTPEPAEAEPEAEAASVEPEAIAEPEAEAASVEPEAAVAEPEAEAEAAPLEPEAIAEPDAEAFTVPATSPGLDVAEAQRLRAAGFSVGDPEEGAEATVSPAAPAEQSEGRRISLAGDELARLRAAGFAPAEAEPDVAPAEFSSEPEMRAVEPESVEPDAVEPDAVEPEAVEPEVAEPEALESEAVEPPAAESEPVAAEVEAVAAEAESAPVAEEPAAETEPAAAGDEPVVAVAESEPVVADVVDAAATEASDAPEATELEEEASEVVLPDRDAGAGDRMAGASVEIPHSEPTPGIAASSAAAPVMKAAARSASPADAAGEQIVETGVGWVETVPMEVETAVAPGSSHEVEPDSPPEPMPADMEVREEPAAATPVRDETMERLRAAGFLIGEPRR